MKPSENEWKLKNVMRAETTVQMNYSVIIDEQTICNLLKIAVRMKFFQQIN